MSYFPSLSRRRFVLGSASAVAAAGLPWSRISAQAQGQSNGPAQLSGQHYQLDIGYREVDFTGEKRLATTINNSLPAPTLRWREGDHVHMRVTNNLAVDSSIHWHGILVPSNMDGVPGMSFDGIRPGASYDYQFQVRQSGTYWYHSHSGFQEQSGLYGALIIDPREPEPFHYDRDYVVVLSDWTDEDPNSVYATLKKEGHYYNFNRRTLADLAADIRAKGLGQTAADRHMWNMMQMSSRDISDVTGYTYTFLMNGHAPADGWVGLFSPGERIRLRIINASSMTFFDVRIPGLKMRVISSDGQYVDPVSVDEIRLGVAETYDVLVEPDGDVPYTLFAQAIDRSGYARGTLTPDPTLRDEVPVMDPTVELTHMDMGMAHDMSAMAGQNSNDMSSMQHDSGGHSGHDMGGSMDMSLQHAPTEFGPNVDMRAEMAPYRLDDPGIGLRDHMQLYGRRVLTYADLHNLRPTPDPREPQREIELHLTGNMHRYMWSINGIDFASAEPLFMHQGERLRITLVNDTMMNHPIHLHGLWSDLETGDMQHIPRKHTVIVQPGSRISYRVSADYLGRWAYHCHLLYHMPGMMREVRVLPGASS